MLAASLAAIALHGHHNCAYAKGDDDDDSEDSGDSGDKANKDDDDDQGEDEDPDDKTQPPVTAGGLFTLKTYPLRETERPLTMTQGITQLRAAIGTDISAKGAFDSAGLNLEAKYGVTDNFTVLGGFDNAYNLKQFSVYAGFEGSLAYDLLDVRVAADVHRNAVPIYQNFCDPPGKPGEIAGGDPAGMAQTCLNGANATIDNLPSGVYESGGTQFSLDIGFPFRYAFKPQVALVALSTLMSIDFNGVALDHVLVQPVGDAATARGHRGLSAPRPPDGTPAGTQAQTATTFVGNGAKPDLNPSIGLLTNPIPQLSIVVTAQLHIPDFDTAAGSFVVPVTAAIEFCPAQQFDVGIAFTLLNVIPPDPQSPIDNRFISAYVQARI